MNQFKYICPQWKHYDGSFDKSMYHIDHIKELRHGGTNHISNLQALCPQCHSVKTNFEDSSKNTNFKIKRNVSEKLKKQVAAQQFFRCANASPIYRSRPYIIGSGIGGLLYKTYDWLF